MISSGLIGKLKARETEQANLPKPSFITHSVGKGAWYNHVMEKKAITPKLDKALSLSLDGSFAHYNLNAITLVFDLEKILLTYAHKPVLYTLVCDGFKKIELDDCYLMDIGLFHETEIKFKQDIPLSAASYATIDYEGNGMKEKIEEDLKERGIKIKKSVPKTRLYNIVNERERLYNHGLSWEREDLMKATPAAIHLINYFKFLSIYNKSISGLFAIDYKNALTRSVDYLSQQGRLLWDVIPLQSIALNYFKEELKDLRK